MMLVFNFENVFLHTQKINRNNHGKGYFIVKQLGKVDSNFSEKLDQCRSTRCVA